MSCSAKVEVVRTKVGDSLLHPMPACQMYIEMDADEYAALVISQSKN